MIVNRMTSFSTSGSGSPRGYLIHAEHPELRRADLILSREVLGSLPHLVHERDAALLIHGVHEGGAEPILIELHLEAGEAEEEQLCRTALAGARLDALLDLGQV